MANTSHVLAISSLTLHLVAACGQAPQPKESAQQATGDVSAKAPAGTPAPQERSGQLEGVVVETMDSGGYTYVKVESQGEETWAAGPQTTVEVGDTVVLVLSAPMKGFHSKTLERTFDSIYFVPSITLKGAGAAGAVEAKPDAAAAMEAAHSQVRQPTPANVEPVERAENGKTIAEVFAERASLSGTRVKVRGQVVKLSTMIMGRNWLHIQDGTGEPESRELVATTRDTAAVGDIVVVEGALATDKDFGAGHKFAAIVEDATVKVDAGGR